MPERKGKIDESAKQFIRLADPDLQVDEPTKSSAYSLEYV
jgi:hypothetical protein